MYKVFLRDKVINFITKECVKADSGIVFHNPDFREIQKILYQIEGDVNQTEFSFVSDDAEKLFIHFYTKMRIVAAAGGFVMDEHNQVLFIFRRGRWDLPKGKIDGDETEEQAAIREVMEETGLQKVALGKRLSSTYHVYTIGREWILKETHWFIMSTDSHQKLMPQAEEGITSLKWVTMDELPEIAKKVFRSLESVVTDAASVLI